MSALAIRSDLVLVPQYRLEWSDASCDWRTEPVWSSDGGHQLQAHAIHPLQGLDFDIVVPRARLDRLMLYLATFARRNTTHLWFALKDASGAVVTRGFLAAEAVRDNQWHECLDLRGVVLSPGELYRVEVRSPLATDRDAFAVWAVLGRPGGCHVRQNLLRLRNERTFVPRPRTAREGTRAVMVIADPSGARGSSLLRQVSSAFPGQAFDVEQARAVEELWPVLADADAVVFTDPLHSSAPGCDFDALCFELHRKGICTIFVDDLALPEASGTAPFIWSPAVAAGARSRRETLRRCRFLFDAQRGTLAEAHDPDTDISGEIGRRDDGAWDLRPLLRRSLDGRMPRIAIVSVLYNKADVIALFIDQVVAQSYPGEIELVLVNDRSPQDDAAEGRARSLRMRLAGLANRSITLIENPENLGNCASRLAGLRAVVADIYVVIDCDCLINADFVAAHVFEHHRPDVDVVIGPLNIESNGEDPTELLTRLEGAPSEVLARSEPQDEIQPDSFLNCITRNFSIKRAAALAEPLFDEDFAYSAKPGSGFGWEDVEMGYRLYARGAVIRFTPLAFAVHVSHASSLPDSVKVGGSMRNYALLFDKHPDLALASRRWAVEVHGKILDWARHNAVDCGAPQRALETRFQPLLEARRAVIASRRPGARSLRILSYRWHVPHQYELHKLPHSFTLATGIGGLSMIDAWSYDQRPLRPNVTFAAANSIDPRDYDLAILHFDENVLAPNLCNGVIPPNWGDPFLWLLGQPDLPKIAICHGTPQFVGQYAADPLPIERFRIHEAERRRLVAALAGVKVVCNSWQAHEEWRFNDARVIWHGFDPQQFPAGRHDLDVLALAPDRHRPHYRGAWQHDEVVARLAPGIGVGTARHAGAAYEPRNSNAFATANFRSYVDRIGRFSFYLNTTLRSPMPRSRGEAMVTGVIPVSLANHDVERFLVNGENGFYSQDPAELADFINFAHRRPERKERIASAARRTAMDIFNHDRFLADWTALIADIGF